MRYVSFFSRYDQFTYIKILHIQHPPVFLSQAPNICAHFAVPDVTNTAHNNNRLCLCTM